MEARKPFVVLEGGSGCGKTTVSKGLVYNLAGWKYFREPGGTEFGDLMREAVQQRTDIEVDPLAAVMAYGASRANLVNLEILPVLDGFKEGLGVLLDRYWFSSYAYQGSEQVDREIIVTINKIATKGLMPDLVLHYDLLPELAMMRKSGASDIDRFDMKDIEFHRRARDAYLELSHKYRDIWQVVDASQSPNAVLLDSLEAMRQRGLI